MSQTHGGRVAKLRPSHWNDDVRWLLAQLLGLNSSPGSDPAALPVGTPSSSVTHYIRGTHPAIAAAGEVVLQMPVTTKAWDLVALVYVRSAGTGANMAPRVGQASGFADDDADDRMNLASQVVAVRFNTVFTAPVPMHADANHRLYFHPSFDAGVDNVGEYQFWFRQSYETGESS